MHRDDTFIITSMESECVNCNAACWLQSKQAAGVDACLTPSPGNKSSIVGADLGRSPPRTPPWDPSERQDERTVDMACAAADGIAALTALQFCSFAMSIASAAVGA